jgi:hypothetical protein
VNNHRSHPPAPSQPVPPAVGGTIAIQDILNIYGFLNTVTNPSEKIIEAKDNLENIILDFSRSLGHR